MNIKILFLLAAVASVAMVSPVMGESSGKQSHECDKLEGEKKLDCRKKMVIDRISTMEKRQNNNNSELPEKYTSKTYQCVKDSEELEKLDIVEKILTKQVCQKADAQKIYELIEKKLTEDLTDKEKHKTNQEIDLLVSVLGEGCEKLHDMWKEYKYTLHQS